MNSRAIVVSLCLAGFVTIVGAPDAEARTPRAKHHKVKRAKSAAMRSTTKLTRSEQRSGTKPKTKRGTKPKRVAYAIRGPSPRASRPVSGQSVGAPWAGRLQQAAELPSAEGYFIRRPNRAFGTRATVELVQRAIGDVLDAFPDVHVLAIGDLSVARGGGITQHHSHQSGRDIDLGLFYTTKPAQYPYDFVDATDDNIDAAATFALLESFAQTTGEDGGVQVMFLGFNVQRMIYNWARDHGIDEERLDRMFQFPHGRGASMGLIRHEPNHDNHVHIRFKCPNNDSACR